MTRSKTGQNQNNTFQPHKSSWTAEEDALLAELVTTRGAKAWCAIGSLLGTRTGKQCRERWRNHLDPAVKKGPFTPKEDEILLRLIAIHGSKWSLIARSIPGRTDNAVKNRFNSSLKRVLEKRKNDTSLTATKNQNMVPTTPTGSSKTTPSGTAHATPTPPPSTPRLTPHLPSRRSTRQASALANLQSIAGTPPIDRRRPAAANGCLPWKDPTLASKDTNPAAKWLSVHRACLPPLIATNNSNSPLVTTLDTADATLDTADATRNGCWEVDSECASACSSPFDLSKSSSCSSLDDDTDDSHDLVMSAAMALIMMNPTC